MKEFIIFSSETVYYTTIVTANSEEEARDWFYENSDEENTKPHGSDFWQIDEIYENTKEEQHEI